MQLLINRESLFSSKANTLKVLHSNLSFSHIDDLLILTYKDFRDNRNNVINEIQNKFPYENIIVRSSNLSEDIISSSKAGKYKTVENVDPKNKNVIITSIEQVFDSYITPYNNDQVFIQRQVSNAEIRYAGVVYTHQLVSGKPYYIINFDTTINSVTNGKTGSAICISREYKDAKIDKEWEILLHSIKELEEVTENKSLDIEFAITKRNEVIIFQVRPIKKTLKCSDKLWEIIFLENEKIKKTTKNTKKCFSDMAFWNPSEIIGDNPFPLDYSIYAKLVTDKAWNVGIRDLGFGHSDNKLMIKIGNKPFIDLNESFFALTPIEIPQTISVKLIAYYLKKIKKSPALHDKIEFQVVLNSFFFGINNLIKQEFDGILNETEKQQLFAALKSNLLKNIKNYNPVIKKDKKEIDFYLRFILTTNYSNLEGCLSFIRELIEVLQNIVVPIFARHARMAFMAKILCDSLAEQNYISDQEKSIFYGSFSSITSEFLKDFSTMSNGDFLDKYGHLRSGTYNIRVDAYKDSVIKPSGFLEKSIADTGFLNSSIAKALQTEGIDLDVNLVIDFIKTTINLRERTKFEYSKGISKLLDAIIYLGQKLNISRNDLSFLEIDDVLSLNPHNFGNISKLIKKKKNNHNLNSLLILPNIIFDDTDLNCVYVLEGNPNFITNETALAEVIYLEGTDFCNCDEKIVLIENADPGYDWLFTHKIKGLITKYGGMGSNMAIKCTELNIPAALGCGNILFDKIVAAKIILLDCEKKAINVKELR
jgi:phosphohistidine swiveling domain-containing protein